MADLRKELREEIDRMATRDLPGPKEFLATYPDKLCAELRKVPWDDEPVTDEDRRAIEEGEKWIRENGGKGIPDEHVMRELGLK